MIRHAFIYCTMVVIKSSTVCTAFIDMCEYMPPYAHGHGNTQHVFIMWIALSLKPFRFFSPLCYCKLSVYVSCIYSCVLCHIAIPRDRQVQMQFILMHFGWIILFKFKVNILSRQLFYLERDFYLIFATFVLSVCIIKSCIVRCNNEKYFKKLENFLKLSQSFKNTKLNFYFPKSTAKIANFTRTHIISYLTLYFI